MPCPKEGEEELEKYALDHAALAADWVPVSAFLRTFLRREPAAGGCNIEINNAINALHDLERTTKNQFENARF
jgi:hypothetical protein